jgi:hypothetical protein
MRQGPGKRRCKGRKTDKPRGQSKQQLHVSFPTRFSKSWNESRAQSLYAQITTAFSRAILKRCAATKEGLP